MKLPVKMAVGAAALTSVFGAGAAIAATTDDASHAASAYVANGSTSVAPASSAQCKGKKVCFWWNKNFKGTFAYASKGKKPKCWTFDVSGNKADSYRIMSGVKARLYDKDSCKGAHTSLLKPGKYPTMGKWANKVSSVMVY